MHGQWAAGDVPGEAGLSSGREGAEVRGEGAIRERRLTERIKRKLEAEPDTTSREEKTASARYGLDGTCPRSGVFQSYCVADAGWRASVPGWMAAVPRRHEQRKGGASDSAATLGSRLD